MGKLARYLIIIGPGMLVAATGVGGGDLATGSFAGSLLGTTILWAVIVGAFLKFVVTEGIARWQLATKTTLLEGLAIYFGRGAIWLFLPYVLLFSFFVGTAMMSSCGVTLHAIFPVFNDPVDGKVFFGIASSMIGCVLVYKGGYPLCEKIMRVCVGIMFLSVIITASLLWPGTDVVLRGIFIPSIPDFHGEGLTWTVALMGGVGGTVTILSYGYWIREEGRLNDDDMNICRIDLVNGYIMTALFGLSVVIIGSHLTIEGGGAMLLVNLSDQLGNGLGPAGKWLFLIGTAGAVFSSLLGVWQSMPYIFSDAWRLSRQPLGRFGDLQQPTMIGAMTPTYRIFLILLTFVPMLGLFTSFREIQKFYTVTGAFFIPFLAVGLLFLNSRAKWVGSKFRNGWPTILSLVATIMFFLWAAIYNL